MQSKNDSRQFCPADISSPGEFILLSGVWVWHGRGWWQTSMFSLHVTYFQIPQESSRFINNRISLFNYELGTDTLQSGVQTSIKNTTHRKQSQKRAEIITPIKIPSKAGRFTKINTSKNYLNKAIRKMRRNQYFKIQLPRSNQDDAQKSTP